jgi:protein gp37
VNNIQLAGIKWVIVGGESGPGARPMDHDWARQIHQQCRRYGIAFFMKQLSAADGRHYKDFDSFPVDLQIREYPEGH